LVEDKGLTLSVHYRLVEEDKAEEVWTIFERIIDAARSLGKVRATSGKKVLEVRPAIAWDKGRAIALLVEKYQRPFHKGKVLAVFLGDDLTDEDGFKVVEKGNGISIFVGEENPGSQARYFLKSPAEVQEFLARLLGRGRQGTR
ncbi:MAG TPA: trehalose-phosphatase, partial [Dehalococcoidia bacterium]|nr:trehalose-phosphatase [Dehalococcoidia bacterium]